MPRSLASGQAIQLCGGAHWRKRAPTDASGETDVADVDGDHQRVEPRPAVRPSGVGATPARQAYAVRFDIVVHQLGPGEAARNIHIVIVSSQQDDVWGSWRSATTVPSPRTIAIRSGVNSVCQSGTLRIRRA